MDQSSPAGRIGAAFGDAAATIEGTSEFLEGGTAALAGLVPDASLVGAPVGVVMNVAGAAVAAKGGAEASLGLYHLSKSATSGETDATKAGREAHKNYDPGPGYDKEVSLPSGGRADAVNKAAGEVRELKPNNPRAVNKGQKQVERYRKELQRIYPKKKWQGKVDTYDQQ